MLVELHLCSLKETCEEMRKPTKEKPEADEHELNTTDPESERLQF